MDKREKVARDLKELRDFLNGEDTLHGLSFGDVNELGRAFWWRKYLDRIDAAIAAQADYDRRILAALEPAPVTPTLCESCGEPATKLCQMTTHQCDPMPICESCAADHDQKAQEVNDHEMSEFGGAYGLCTYHYLPLPSATPVTSAQAVEADLIRRIADVGRSREGDEAHRIMPYLWPLVIEAVALRAIAEQEGA